MIAQSYINTVICPITIWKAYITYQKYFSLIYSFVFIINRVIAISLYRSMIIIIINIIHLTREKHHTKKKNTKEPQRFFKNLFIAYICLGLFM